jgi:hypothetical protein
MDIIQEKYNTQWFKDRAFRHLKKIEDGVWDLSDSLLLYTSSGPEIYEELQETNSPYFNLVTKPERDYLVLIAKNIADILPDNFEYIDLGPGTEHKEQFLFDELKKKNRRFVYTPVDISDQYLDLAESHARNQGIEVKKIKSSFEELPDLIGKQNIPRFVSIGLTFSNYYPQEILGLLRKIAGDGGYIFINSQIRDRVDMDELQKVYQNDAEHLADEKVKFIGLNPDTDISPRLADQGFHVWTTILKNNEALEKVGVRVGDKIMVFQSLRYTKESLENELKNLNHQIFDVGSSFIASIIKT